MTNVRSTAVLVVSVWVATGVLGAIGVTIRNPTNPVARFFNNLFDPALLLAIGLGTSALIAFFAMLGATSTFRAAIATSLTIVFLGLLLMPSDFRALTSEEFTETFIWAWTVMIGFYFGTEGALQAVKMRQPKSSAGGDAESVSVTPLTQEPTVT